jgi:MinD superfamily P-loop ATPase
MGVIERGQAALGISFARGVLDVGEPMAVPVIRQLKKWAIAKPGQVVIRDTPPGTSCPVVETIRGSDYLLLVTEPTPFGLHDLKLAVDVAHELQVPAGIVLNRWEANSRDGHYSAIVEAYCREQGLPILLRIPFERQIAEGIAQGKTLVDIDPDFAGRFCQMFSPLAAL